MSWHGLCDTYVTFKPTTPPLSQITSDRNDNFCQTVVLGACRGARFGYASCNDATILADRTKLSSCTCAPSIIQNEYSCLYLGNTSCLATGATVSDLPAFSRCSNFAEAISSAKVDQPRPFLSLTKI